MASKIMTNNVAASGIMAEAVSDAEIVAQFRQRGCWGLYTSVDMKGCDPAAIRDAEKIRQFIVELCDLIDMKRFGEPQVIHFGPCEKVAGFSMTQLIETSLVSGHFANETNAAYLDIFSCKEYEPSKAAEFCKSFFGAESVKYQVLFRD
jgi:S-adenosylmethionine/arginine decarboxylase-like enzyme|nr:S-adenosylmethionine decarboxylase [Methanoculleus marisnigri]